MNRNSEIWDKVFDIHIQKGETPKRAAELACEAVSLREAASSLDFKLLGGDTPRVPKAHVAHDVGSEQFKARQQARTALLDWLEIVTGTREGHDARVVEAMGDLAVPRP